MCSKYKINNVWYETVSDLMALIPKSQLSHLRSFDESPLIEDACLCPINHKSVADFLGQKVASDGLDLLFGEHADEISDEYKCGETYVPEKRR